MENEKASKYQLLDRLKTDCEYFLGAGKGCEKHLWAGSVSAQIEKMKELYNSFLPDEKPEWITMEKICDYDNQMTEIQCLNEKLRKLQIGNIESDGDGYLYFTIIADEYQLDGIYRIFDLNNGDSLKLVSIDYGYLHPEIAKEWNDIETTLTEYTCVYMHELYTQALSNINTKEEITLHLKYKEPVNFNGITVYSDTIKFGSYEELLKYVSGEMAYNLLDDSVRKSENELLHYAENENGGIVWGTKDYVLQQGETIEYGGFDYRIIDKWEDGIGIYIIGRLEADDGPWFAAKVTDTTEQYHGQYEYEFGNKRPMRNEVEDMHLNHISEIDIDRNEAEYGADGSRMFPQLNAPTPEEKESKKCENQNCRQVSFIKKRGR